MSFPPGCSATCERWHPARVSAFMCGTEDGVSADAETVRLLRIVEDNEAQEQKYQQFITTIHSINNVIRQVNQDWYVLPTGSSVTGLLGKDGDLDLTLVSSSPFEDQETDVIRLNSVAEKILDCGITRNYALKCSKIKVLSFKTTEGVDVDVTVAAYHALYDARLMRLYNCTNRKFSILSTSVKIWAKIKEIKGAKKGGLSSHAINIMSVCVMQAHNQLPAWQASVPEKFTTDEEAPQSLAVQVPQWKELNNSSSSGELLTLFFEYWSAFNFQRDVVSITHGHVRRRNLQELEAPMFVEDPINKQNVTSSISDITPFVREIWAARRLVRQGLQHEVFQK